MARLDGKVAFLTGAGAGIAKATAQMFVKEGARVALIELNREAGARAEREIKVAGGEALFIETDVTNAESMERAVEATVARFGGLDILFNCAGGSLQEDVPVHEMDLKVWHHTVALNLLHPFLSCRYGIPHMMKAGGGVIINVTSHLGLMGSMKPAYAATKGGIIAFTKTLAAQYADYGIRANAIAPGSIRTERQIKRYENKDFMLAENPGPAARTRTAFQKLYPFSKGDPEHIASIALFLASEDSRMLTGTTLAADGGRSSYIKVYTED
ncbi:MAG TPA: SDR family NAD(P)-dependent oxidoreductase [Burkholderiales bacterium]|nr:SDR family NAD(P)-dependent oxidoreductase [Burkholderiales bacterium]